MSDDETTKPSAVPEVVPAWAADLTTLVRRVSTNVDNVISAVDVLRDRVNAHDARFAEQDTRASNVSIRVRDASRSDLEQAAQLAQERASRESLATKVDELSVTNATQLAILSRLDKITSNPTVKVIAGMIATALLTWLASHGGNLK